MEKGAGPRLPWAFSCAHKGAQEPHSPITRSFNEPGFYFQQHAAAYKHTPTNPAEELSSPPSRTRGQQSQGRTRWAETRAPPRPAPPRVQPSSRGRLMA